MTVDLTSIFSEKQLGLLHDALEAASPGFRWEDVYYAFDDDSYVSDSEIEEYDWSDDEYWDESWCGDCGKWWDY